MLYKHRVIIYIKSNRPPVKLIQWSLGRRNRLRAVFLIMNKKILRMWLRTIAYIDGFNLYFGSLKNTHYKWLDISALANLLCKEQNTQSQIIGKVD